MVKIESKNFYFNKSKFLFLFLFFFQFKRDYRNKRISDENENDDIYEEEGCQTESKLVKSENVLQSKDINKYAEQHMSAALLSQHQQIYQQQHQHHQQMQHQQQFQNFMPHQHFQQQLNSYSKMNKPNELEMAASSLLFNNY